MKIIVKHKDTEIIVSENENDTKDRVASMGGNDQDKHIQEIIIVICEQINKLQNSVKE